jgi:hypothetical protein
LAGIAHPWRDDGRVGRGRIPPPERTVLQCGEDPRGRCRFLLKIEDRRFSGVFNDGLDENGEWYVGWSGTIAVQGDHIELRDPREGTTETLRFAVTGDRLTLIPLSATPDTLKGVPTLAFDHAYLAAEPFVRVDCAKVTPPCT